MAIPYPSGYPLLGSGSGAGGAGTFAEFLERRRQYAGYIDQHVPSVVLLPAPCGHCGKLEDLRRDWDTYSHSDGSVPQLLELDGSLADQIDQIAFEGSSCFTCAKKVFLATTDWIPIDCGEHPHDTPLHYAARSGNLRMLFHLLCLLGDGYGHEAQYAVLALRKLNVHGETALHNAIRLVTSKFMVRMLMWVDPHLALHHAPGSTSPLYLAVSLGHKDIAEMLHTTSGGNLSYSGPHRQNALHAAVHHMDGMIEMLLHWKKDLSTDKDTNDSTPLHSLVSAQSEDYVRRKFFCFPDAGFPLEKHATWLVLNANPSAAYQHDSNGLLPVHIAAMMDRKVAILILLERHRGCIALRDKQGRSFLHIAVRNKVRRIVKYACQEPVFGPILNARDNDGNTALHLAVEVEDLETFCHLLKKPEVLLNVRNNKDQTPLDIARSKKVTNFSYLLNPGNVIYSTLSLVGASHGSFWRDHVQQLCIKNQSEEVGDLEKHKKTDDEKKKGTKCMEKQANHKKKEDEEKKDSDQLTDSTRALGIGSVLITTMTFGATFAVPSAVVKAGNGGILATWYLDAFMMANTLAFFCSLMATFVLIFSSMSMVKLQVRREWFQVALVITSSSLTSLIVAFLLGLHIVLASVGRSVSDAIFLITPLLLGYQTRDLSIAWRLTYQPLSVRQGPEFVYWLFVRRYIPLLLLQYWTYIVIFSWAASRKPAA
ncbi:hypothetical protein ACQJBY_000142 [Aegilops geniculata]